MVEKAAYFACASMDDFGCGICWTSQYQIVILVAV